jgi:hypothetical protein
MLALEMMAALGGLYALLTYTMVRSRAKTDEVRRGRSSEETTGCTS